MHINVNIIKGVEYDDIVDDDSGNKLYILDVSKFPMILNNILLEYININQLRFEILDVEDEYYILLGYRVVSYKIYFTITAEDSQQLINFLSNEIIKYRFWFPCCYHISRPQYTLIHNRIRNN